MPFLLFYANLGDFLCHFCCYGGNFEIAAILPKIAISPKNCKFGFLLSHTNTIPKIRKFGEMSLPGFGTVSQKVGLNFLVYI